jgi:hypothetical protein
MAEQVRKKVPLLDDDGNELLDDNGEVLTVDDESPVETKPPSELQQLITSKYQPPEQGMLSKVWDKLSSPLTTIPSQIVKPIADYIDRPIDGGAFFDPNTAMGKYEQFGKNLNAGIRGFGAGSLQAVGDIISGLSSPIDLAATALTGGSNLAARAGLKSIAPALSTAARLTSAPVVAHGAINTLSPDSTLTERATGLMEIAGGSMGMRGPDAIPDTSIPVTDTPVDRNSPMFAKNQPPVTPEAGPKIGTTIRLKNPSLENIKKARMEGYEPQGGLDTNGKLKMVYTGNKMADEILETEVGSQRVKLGPSADTKKTNPVTEAFNLPRALMATMDFSAPGRQGIGLIHKKEFWNSLGPMFKSWKSEDFFNEMQKSISEKPLFKSRVSDDGKRIPSFAEDSGLKLTDLNDLNNREEAIMSTWAEKIPAMGGVVRRSNRAYTTFLNKLRADTFESLVKSGKAIGAGGEANVPLAKEIATFVNNATGRGSLDFGRAGSLEKAATALNTAFFSPRLIASRIQMMNPANYVMASPTVRKEMLKSMAAIGAAGNTVLALGSQIPGAETEIDPRSPDFMKLKIGDIRLDPWGGFQQYIVQTAKQVSGQAKSTESGNIYDLGSKYGLPTRRETLLRFGEQKLNPVLTLFSRALEGKDFDGSPFNLPEQLVQRFIPILMADLKQLATDNPDLLPMEGDEYENFHPENLPFAIPAAFGMGMQQYSKK